jgi:hypothetical protein
MGSKIELRDVQHLWIQFDPPNEDYREVIIDKEQDVRVCDQRTVVKVRFLKNRIRDVLIDDTFITTPRGIHVGIDDIKDILKDQLEREPTVAELESCRDCLDRDVGQWVIDNVQWFLKNEMP